MVGLILTVVLLAIVLGTVIGVTTRFVADRVTGPALPWAIALQWGLIASAFLSVITPLAAQVQPGWLYLLVVLLAFTGLYGGLGGLFLSSRVAGPGGRPPFSWGAKVAGIAGALLFTVGLMLSVLLGLIRNWLGVEP